MSARASPPGVLDINVGLIGVGVVGSSVLDFFARGPMDLPVPGARMGVPGTARVRIWSAARRSRHNPKGAPAAFVERVVSKDKGAGPRFYYDVDNEGGAARRVSKIPAWRQIVRDEDVDIVVELTGSPTAEAIIEEALWNGKCVVTANKAVLSRSGYQLARLAQERGTALACEAAVGGGMPIVQAIASGIGGRITALLAIINGTTNFILTEMARARGEQARAAYPAAVCAAIHKGLAEADPGADVLGEDARSKVIILAGLAFGARLRPQDVYVRGMARRGSARGPAPEERAAYHACPGDGPCPDICGRDDHVSTQPVLDATDMAVLRELGYVPKLLAGAQQDSHGRVVAWVQPAAVPAAHPLAGVTGSENACVLDVESPVEGGGAPRVQRYAIALRGPGAGGPETASSVIADIQFCARQLAVQRASAHGHGPLYMYGAGAFSRTQACGPAPAMLESEHLVTPFLLRFARPAGSGGGEIARALALQGLGAEPVRQRAASAYAYFKTSPASVRAIEGAMESVLQTFGPARMGTDVLYLPVLAGARWEERAA